MILKRDEHESSEHESITTVVFTLQCETYLGSSSRRAMVLIKPNNNCLTNYYLG